MGGSSTGLVGASYDVKVAANHWGIAIETHSANHPGTEHLCADISNIDLRYLPKTDLLWASPICTEVSPAGGRRKRTPQLDLFEEHGHVPTEAFERTRVTFWEVIRAAEIHRYKAVLIENVVEAASWELFDIWLAGMSALGYEHQFISVSAAHVGSDSNPHAPQWRDRLYIGFVQKGIKMPDLQPRPIAWCETCGHDVKAVQAWKKSGRRIGKYGPQYTYVCPRPHANGQVEPYVAPASTAIDWSNPGIRIGDRAKPLGAATLRRIQMGLETVANPALIAAGGNTWDRASGAKNNYLRAWPLDGSPTPAQVTAIQNGVATTEPFTIPVGGTWSSKAIPLSRPMRTQTTAQENGLVIPYRKGAKPYAATTGPLSTMATRDQHGLLEPAIEIEDCYFRMLSPREAANAQAFPREYVIHGNQGEQQMQAGNAVAVNVAHDLGARMAEAIA